MATRTPEEVLEQREAWLARKAAREAGEDVPLHPPLKPGEVFVHRNIANADHPHSSMGMEVHRWFAYLFFLLSGRFFRFIRILRWALFRKMSPLTTLIAFSRFPSLSLA